VLNQTNCLSVTLVTRNTAQRPVAPEQSSSLGGPIVRVGLFVKPAKSTASLGGPDCCGARQIQKTNKPTNRRAIRPANLACCVMKQWRRAHGGRMGRIR